MEVNRNYPDILLVPRDRTKGNILLLLQQMKFMQKKFN